MFLRWVQDRDEEVEKPNDWEETKWEEVECVIQKYLPKLAHKEKNVTVANRITASAGTIFCV